jgi:V8-like Glu-specific endopeptidase
MVPLIPTLEQSIELAFVVNEKVGNYFYCDCKRLEGSSGSPLLKDNNVVGIMHGGNDNGLCAFLKSDVVLKIIS